MNKAIPRANRPPKVRASDGLMAVAAPVEAPVAALEVEVEVPEAVLSVPEEAVVPAVPFAVDPPGRLTVDLAASAL
jgi:hypothetical protein